jgi:hypothetical protein
MENTQKLIIAQSETISTSTAWLLFLFFGWSYGSMGKVGKQILFYLTFGGVGVWAFIRLFTLNSDIKNYNNGIYLKHGLNDMVK